MVILLKYSLPSEVVNIDAARSTDYGQNVENEIICRNINQHMLQRLRRHGSRVKRRGKRTGVILSTAVGIYTLRWPCGTAY